MPVMQAPSPPYAPSSSHVPAAAPRSALPLVALLAVSKSDVANYPCGSATTVAVATTAAAMQSLEQLRPRIVVIDWDLATLDASTVCRAAAQRASTTILITTQFPDRVPAALRCGCHAVLLKPFTVNLAAARLGRLCRDASVRWSAAIRSIMGRGTNRTFPATPCPQCGKPGAISFDFASHRTSWYACITCDHVWRGPRQE
jgi:DNA-binding response OmpR family regulator